MAGVMKRWDNVRALGALNQWRDAVDRRQAQRQAALSALSFWTRQGQAKAFYAWHEEVVMSYNHHMAGRVHGLHLKAHAYQAWHEHTARAEKRAVVGNVIQYMLHSKLTGAFEAWITWTVERQDRRQKAERLIRRWQAWNLASAFRAFQTNRLYCQRERLADMHFEKLSLRHALHMWQSEARAQALHSDKLMVAAMRWRQMSLASAFSAWVHWHQEHCQQQQFLDLVLRRWAHGHTSHAFATWQHWAQEQRALRATALQCILRLRHRQLASAFNALHSRAMYSRMKRHCIWMWRQRTLTAIFLAFRINTYKSQCARRALRFWSGKTVVRTFQAWRTFKTRRHYLSQTLAKALASWKSQTLAQAFAGWQDGALALQRKRLLLTRALGTFQHRQLHTALAAWRDGIEEATLDGQQNQLAAEHWRRKMLWTGMAALHEQCKLRRLANKGLRNLMNGRLSRAWASWVDHIQGCAIHPWDGWRNRSRNQHKTPGWWLACCLALLSEIEVTPRSGGRRLLRGLTTQRDHTADVRDEQKAVEATSALLARSQTFCQKIFYALNRWHSSWRLMDSFHQWKSQAQERKVFRALTGAAFELRYVHLGRQVLAAFCEAVHDGKQGRKALIFWQGNAAHQSFQIWRGFCQQQQSKQQKIAKALEWWHGRSLASLFKGWRSALQEQKQLRTVSAQVVWRHMAGLTQRALRGWKEGVAWQKTSQQRLDNAHALLADRKLCLTFDAWRNRCVEEHNQRVSISILQGRATARRMLGLLANWSVVVRQRRAVTEAIAMRLAGHYILKPFVAWREAAMWWGGVRRLTASALALYTSHSQAQVFCHTTRSADLRQRLTKAVSAFQNSAARAAFNAWLDNTQQMREGRAQGLAAFAVNREHAILARAIGCATRLQLSRAWRGWASYLLERREKHAMMKSAALACFASRRQQIWQRWRLHVSRQKKMRLCLKQHQAKFRRAVLVHWRAVTGDRRELREKGHILLELIGRGWVREAFQWWRGIIKAEACFRRMRLRAALTCWAKHIATRRHWAERLRGATNILMFGSLARTFTAWHVHARDMGIRQRAFAQKQKSIQAALEIGDGIARRERRLLLKETFLGWCMRARLGSVASARFRKALAGTQQLCWTSWKAVYCHKRQKAGLLVQAAARANRNSLHRWFQAWRSSTDTAFHLRQERLAEAAEFAFAQTLGWTFHSWRAAAGSGKARREALQGTLQDLFARLSHEQGPRTWLRRWRSASTRARQTHMRAQMLAQQRSQRLQQSVFSVWASYTAAMQSDPDPASPFASPRTPLADRHLIQHLALMTGHELTLCSSSHSAAGESAASEPS
ncbi:hypothetical protein WJX84_008517 [Apatococcus fuscideae]|uniref:Sfi1 spindle body domain-containing protein n=1 Tax=Apatococcus fuscideae TaxID=2026836 RepID=A0AAW1T5J7_9CHLO